MRRYDLTFLSVNSEAYPKPITATVVEPETRNAETGAMLFTHGWGGNRFQHQDKMEYTADAFNLVCISAEYRSSGYDFDPVKGRGAVRPYDASFYQVFDVLNALRTVLALRSDINRQRLFHYGGSQGGHIALLSAIFAPATFGFVYASCPLTHLDEAKQAATGRNFAEYELAARSVLAHAEAIRCPVFIEHGTADSTVPVAHTEALEQKLQALGKTQRVVYYAGGEHSLAPATTKMEAFKAMAPEPMRQCVNPAADDFSRQSRVELDCGGQSLEIDWSQAPEAVALFRWNRIR